MTLDKKLNDAFDPEEMNRKLTGSIATYHFAPTASSESNLKKENINTDHLYVTGNTVIDALDTTVQDNYVFDDAAHFPV